MSESAAVSEHIYSRQRAVLERAIHALSTGDPDALPAEVHRLRGTLGTYLLPDAVAALEPLQAALAEQATGATLGRLLEATLEQLRAQAAAMAGDA